VVAYQAVLYGRLAVVLGTLSPRSLVQVGLQAHADRYMYVPMVGLLVMLHGERPTSWRDGNGRKRVLAGIAGARCVLLFGARTK